MQNFTPVHQTLHYIPILPCVAMRESRASTPTPDNETVCALFVPYLRWMEILLQVADHAVARVTIRPQERVIVSYAVLCLPHHLLREPWFPAVLGRERLDRALFLLGMSRWISRLLRFSAMISCVAVVMRGSRSRSSAPFASSSSCTVLIGATQVKPNISRTSGAWLSWERYQRRCGTKQVDGRTCSK